jgi:hypothetical protein
MNSTTARTEQRKLRNRFAEWQTRTASQFDEIFARALKGDRRSINAVALFWGKSLLKEAERGLGRDYAHEAPHVVEAFLAAFVDGVKVGPGKGCCRVWMRRTVRAIARKYRVDPHWEGDWNIDDAP